MTGVTSGKPRLVPCHKWVIGPAETPELRDSHFRIVLVFRGNPRCWYGLLISVSEKWICVAKTRLVDRCR